MQTMGTYKKWKRFRPKLRGRLSDQTVYEPDSVYAEARMIALRAVGATKSGRYKPDTALKRCARAVASLKNHHPEDTAHLMALLILQTPAAVRAQREMDRHRGGYKNRQARLFELIDFNDTFVDTVLTLEVPELRTFTDRLKSELDYFCQYMNVASLSDKQYEAIAHGLSREIALYIEAKKLGYHARMTSRSQDAMGVDMVITDPTTKRSIGVDVKTHSAYHWRLIDLQRRNRLSEEERLQCELAGFCGVTNGKGERAIDTVLFRIATDRLGPIHHYRFVESEPVAELLVGALKYHGKYLTK